MPKLAAAVDTLFAEVRASIENAHALGMYDPVTSLPNRLHFRSEADKLLGDAASRQQLARCCSSTSTASRWSTTALAMPAATSC